ncbi:winged helix-turn-helix domain-containing protein [Caldinitratiruptor microaerophilus]|uniref:Stage 0 sporulation protein A homolog n=1 Tax=Caldinitratiruptor microaerophilus TaxID=671077 RepID=A0AA35G6U6_9FIRM|nr:response regulator transcription factor [Caldinitratiruptor microaerophilus]BDG59075.1 DNA-binding response regulator [Caldinitratiruptor microaerophilus]
MEDEPAIATLIEYNLRRAGFQTRVAGGGKEALAAAVADPPDLVLLDIMLPDADGRDVCRELRRRGDVPVIFLTARDAEVDRIVGLELGADDYVTKPFSPGELVARVRAVLRRAGRPAQGNPAGAGAAAAPAGGLTAGEPEALRVGELYLDRARHEARRGDRPLHLTPTEFSLLECFMTHPGIVLSREQLLDRVWGVDYFGDPRLVDVHIRHLREKIEDDPADPRWIVTVRGAGYKLREG